MSLQKTIDWVNDIVTKHKRGQMIKSVAMQKAKINYKNKTGQDMTPSMMDNEARGMMLSKETKGYLKDKKMIEGELKTKMTQKGVY